MIVKKIEELKMHKICQTKRDFSVNTVGRNESGKSTGQISAD